MYFISILLILKIIFLMILSLKILSNKSKSKMMNDYPFECGVSSNESSRKSFSLPFFIITLVFLLFDMEILLIFPLCFSQMNLTFILYFLTSVSLILLSLILEWLFGSLIWTNCDNLKSKIC